MLKLTGTPVYEYTQGDTFFYRLVFRTGFSLVKSVKMTCKGISLSLDGAKFDQTVEGVHYQGFQFRTTFTTKPTAGTYDYDLTVTYTDGTIETCAYRAMLIVREKVNV